MINTTKVCWKCKSNVFLPIFNKNIKFFFICRAWLLHHDEFHPNQSIYEKKYIKNDQY